MASIIAGVVARLDDVTETFGNLGKFVAIVVGGMVVNQTLTLPLIYFLFTFKNPYPYLLNMFQAWLVAFSIASRFVFSLHFYWERFPNFFHLVLRHMFEEKIGCRCYRFSGVLPSVSVMVRSSRISRELGKEGFLRKIRISAPQRCP